MNAPVKPLPSQERLNELLRYDPETGNLFWRERPDNKQFTSHFAGKIACAAKDRRGYLTAKIDGRAYLTHRIIWKLVYGVDPDTIDHINGDKPDNRLENIRSVSLTSNNRNKRLHHTNKSGTCGVRWMGHSWQANIVVDGKTLYLGRYQTFDGALRQRKNAERLYGFSDRHGAVS